MLICRARGACKRTGLDATPPDNPPSHGIRLIHCNSQHASASYSALSVTWPGGGDGKRNMLLQLKVLRCCARFELIDVLVVLRCHFAHMLHSLRNWYAKQLICPPIVTDLCQEREDRYADRDYFLRLKCSVACFKVGVLLFAYRALFLRFGFQKQRVIILTV